jgi:hypothetical protein
LALATVIVWVDQTFPASVESVNPRGSWPTPQGRQPGYTPPTVPVAAAPETPTTTVSGSGSAGETEVLPLVVFPSSTTIPATAPTTGPRSPVPRRAPTPTPAPTTTPDTTNPVVTINTPANGASYSQGAVVNASYSCSDSGSGIDSCVGTVANGSPINTSTLGNRTFTVTATDNAGNTTTVTRTYTVVDTYTVGDTTDPVVTIITPANGASYSQGAVVNASYSCSDSGSGIDSCVGTVANGSPINTSTLGNRTFTVTATDNAGNTTTVTRTYTVVDTTDPVVTIITPAVGLLTARVLWSNASYSCSDSGSGIDSCVGTVANGSPINTSTLGNRTFTVTATDNAGNTTTVTRTYTVVDTTDPVVTIITPASGASYSQGAVVNASYSCSDSGSGIDSCVGTVANGSPINTSTLGNRTFTVTATDNAGNTRVVTHTYTVVPPPDTTDPVVTLVTPANGAEYMVGEVVVVDYRCSDSGSGIAECQGTQPNGSLIDTTTPGSRTFTVTATDNAGNTTVVTHTYTVVLLPD